MALRDGQVERPLNLEPPDMTIARDLDRGKLRLRSTSDAASDTFLLLWETMGDNHSRPCSMALIVVCPLGQLAAAEIGEKKSS